MRLFSNTLHGRMCMCRNILQEKDERRTKMTIIELDNLYNTNKEFKEYVDKYSRAHRLLPEYTIKLKVVQNYAEWLRGGKR